MVPEGRFRPGCGGTARCGTCARPPGKLGAGPEKPRRTVRQFLSNIVSCEEIILKPEGALSSLKKIGVTVTYAPGLSQKNCYQARQVPES